MRKPSLSIQVPEKKSPLMPPSGASYFDASGVLMESDEDEVSAEDVVFLREKGPSKVDLLLNAFEMEEQIQEKRKAYLQSASAWYTHSKKNCVVCHFGTKDRFY